MQVQGPCYYSTIDIARYLECSRVQRKIKRPISGNSVHMSFKLSYLGYTVVGCREEYKETYSISGNSVHMNLKLSYLG